MTRFLLIRHATNDTVGKIIAGRMAGVYLNEEGKQQAEKLAERLSKPPIHAIYSSPLERAVDTGEPLARQHQLQTIIDEDFLEVNFGQWTSRSLEELRNNSQFHLFNTLRSCTRIPGGETMLEAQARIIRGMEKLCSKHPNETVAIISHGDLIKAAVAYYAGIHLDLFQRIEISPASVSVVEVYDDSIRIVVLNHTDGIMM